MILVPSVIETGEYLTQFQAEQQLRFWFLILPLDPQHALSAR